MVASKTLLEALRKDPSCDQTSNVSSLTKDLM
jgi:hypothetical protein